MKDLAVRLAALDEDAGAALRVIAYFDSLVASRAGLQAIVRGAAVLAGVPARLDDAGRRVHIRVLPDGSSAPAAAGPGAGRPLGDASGAGRSPVELSGVGSAPGDGSGGGRSPAGLSGVGRAPAEAPGAGWPRTEVGERAVLALERTGGPGPVDAMILERAAGAARAVLDRTRGRAPAEDPASVELVVDAAAPLSVREVAARTLGLTGEVRAAARPTGPVVLASNGVVPRGRVGVGPPGPVADLPASYAAARIALRFAADGTDEDPGPTVVDFASLGGLALLASAPLPASIPDLDALSHAATAAPWAPATLQAFADTPSLRGAAATLRVHHSTLQDRIVHLEHLLDWPLRTPSGKLRLQIALALRRLARHPA